MPRSRLIYNPINIRMTARALRALLFIYFVALANSVAAQQPPPPDRDAPEVSSRDIPATFKVRVNAVLVRVVVRDSDGKVVRNLKKEDFQLEDNRKVQIISNFSVEVPGSNVPAVNFDADSSAASSGGTPVKAPELPQRFVTLFFDDLHLSLEDTLLSRQAATKLLATMSPDDRFSVFTTSGQVEQEFTADRDKLGRAILRIVPRVASGASAFNNLDALIKRMSGAPGQRVIVMMSPGFLITPLLYLFEADIIDRATRADVAINTIDARGLYVPSVYDASVPNFTIDGARPLDIMTAEAIQNSVLAELADGTGGTFFHNRNDIDVGLLQAAAEPEVSYLLGFTPQNLKLDGEYHHLDVRLPGEHKWTLQARHGYFAPRSDVNPEIAGEDEIQQALFSQEEMHDLPVECQTRFFRNAKGVRLTVLAHVTTKGLKFLKVGDRSKNKLTIATAIFDENGNFLTGLERKLDMQLKTGTLERINRAGIVVSSSFDLQPGTFIVRIVIRDLEGSQMAAMNRGVMIPR